MSTKSWFPGGKNKEIATLPQKYFQHEMKKLCRLMGTFALLKWISFNRTLFTC
jgi:hypothetical protein